MKQKHSRRTKLQFAVEQTENCKWVIYDPADGHLLDLSDMDEIIAGLIEFRYSATQEEIDRDSVLVDTENDLRYEQEMGGWNNYVFDDAPAPKRKDIGFVYLIQSPTGYYKIGKTKNINDRRKIFEVKLPFEIEFTHVISCEYSSRTEIALHEKFKDCRAGGEWFGLSPEQVEWIKSIKDDSQL